MIRKDNGSNNSLFLSCQMGLSDGTFFMLKDTPLSNRYNPISSPIYPIGVVHMLGQCLLIPFTYQQCTRTRKLQPSSLESLYCMKKLRNVPYILSSYVGCKKNPHEASFNLMILWFLFVVLSISNISRGKSYFLTYIHILLNIKYCR